MSARRRLLWILGLTAGICFMMGLLWSTQAPRVRSWALVKINEISERELPVRVLPTDIQFRLFPLSATISGINIKPKPELERMLTPMRIEEVTVELSLLQLVQGRLRMKEVLVRGAAATVHVPRMKKTDQPPLGGLFALLAQVPLDRLRLEAINVNLDLAQPKLKADIRDITATAENTGRSLALDIEVGSTHVKDGDSAAAVRVNLNARALLLPKGATISELKLRRGDSYMVASGRLQGDTEALKFSDIQFNTRSSLHLESMRNWLAKNFPRLEVIPHLKGRADIDATVQMAKDGVPVVDFGLKTHGLYEDHFFIDRLETNGTFRQGLIKMPKFRFTNPGARVLFSDVEIRIPKSDAANGSEPAAPDTIKPITIKTVAQVEQAQLFDFLKTLGLPNVPVHLDVKGQVPCEGTFTPQFRLSCHGEMEGDNFILHEQPTIKGSIVALPKFKAKGEFTVDAKEVTYKTELAMPKSKGRSSGVIGYKTGFKISYEGDVVDLADVANLADLRIEGVGKIKGTTEGDSHAATLKMQLEMSDGWFENYWLGNAKTEASYKAGTLFFKNVSGHYTTSRYNGDVSVQLINKTIRVDGKMPFFDTRDMLKVFSRRVQLPVPVTGTGKVDIKAWGPLEFTKLSYDLNTTAFRGTIAREAFDEAHFDVRSRDGQVSAERVLIARGQQTISLTGNGYPNGDIKTMIRGRAIKLEESVNVSQLGLSLSGQADFDMDLTGYVLGPTTDLHGTITKSAIGDQGVPDSSFHLKFTSKTIEGGGEFLGDVLKTNFVLPLTPQAPFTLKLKTREWNYAPLFAAIAGPAARKDYEGSLTSDIQLSAASGGFWNSTGTISANKFLLRRGALQMTAPQPIKLSMQQGRLRVDSFFLEGDGTFLRATETSNPVAKMDAQVNGKLDLSLIALALPFFEELRGVASFAFNVRAGPSLLAVLGSIYIDKGYLKLFGFPHPFEDIKGDFLFSQNKVLINSLKSELSGGQIAADGTVELKGTKNYPIQISATAERVTLNIPENVRTTGSGRLFFTGHWFPFQMKGVYDVRSANITREFTQEATGNGSNVQRSAFLPRVLLEENFSPIEMDLQIHVPTPVDIKNSMVEGKLTGDLKVKGPPGRLSVLGTANAEKGSKINFRENIFDLSAGVVTFNDPNELNPQLYVTANTRVSNYDVNLVLQGTPKKPELNLTSSPPLSDQDIISLLALGIPGQQLDTSKNQADSLGFNIGNDLFKNNPATDVLKSRTGIEVGFSTGFDETNNVAVPKITASRKVSRKFGVTASRSLGQDPKTEAKARYELSNRLSIVGSWEGQEFQENAENAGKPKEAQDKFGLDFEYKFEFK